jgi:tetratricopeptide (TPR) repeat protein
VPDPLVSEAVVRAARDLLDAGRYAAVVAVCCEQLELRPADVALLLLRARAWIALGRSAHAIDDLREVLAIDPQCAGAYRALGRLLLRAGDLSAARAALLGALQLSGDDLQVREQLAAVDAALALEATLAAEAAALEEALEFASADPELASADPELASADPELASADPALADASLGAFADGSTHRPRAASPRMQRLQTQPMARASTSVAPWRAPTIPLEQTSHGRHSILPAARHGRRAPTQPMARASTSAAPWRAPTMPVGLRPESSAAGPRSRTVEHASSIRGPIRATTAPFQRRAATAPGLGRAITAVFSAADSPRVPLALDDGEARAVRAGSLDMAGSDE